MVICLERGANLHMAQLMPLPLTVSCFTKIQNGLPFWHRLTRVVPDKEPLNGCVCVCIYIMSKATTYTPEVAVPDAEVADEVGWLQTLFNEEHWSGAVTA